jgi:hypothetical protein
MISAARAAILGAVCLAAAACTAEKPTSAKSNPNCSNDGSVAAAICADPALQKLDGEIASALHNARALYPNDPAAARALDEAHAGALALRERAGAEGAISLADAMQGERDFLLALTPAREGFEGRWLNLQGDILIAQEPDGLGLNAVAAEQSRGAWVCEVQAPASLVQNMLVAATSSRGVGDPPLDGWIIEGERQGATLFVKEIAPRAALGAEVAIRPYCGMNGGLDGSYFPAKPK